MITLQSEEQLQTEFHTGSVLLLFSADWCPDCRFIEAFMPEVEEKFADDFTFVFVDRDKFLDLCGEYGVLGIPSFVALHNGEVIDDFISKDRKTQKEIESFLQGASAKVPH